MSTVTIFPGGRRAGAHTVAQARFTLVGGCAQWSSEDDAQSSAMEHAEVTLLSPDVAGRPVLSVTGWASAHHDIPARWERWQVTLTS